MTNIIRADVYRIVRGKGLYITLAVFLAIIILQIVGGVNMNAGVNLQFDEFIDLTDFDMENFDIGSLNLSDIFYSPTGAESPFQVMEASSNILYLLLPLIIFISAADFSSGAAKNTLAGGTSRAKFYCAKLVLSCVCCALMLLTYVVLSILAATLVNGFGGTFDGAYLMSVLKIFLPQLWLCIAGVSVGNFFVFAFQKSAAVNGFFIAFLLVPSILILSLSFISDWFEKLFDYELTMCIGSLAQIDTLPTGGIVRIVAVGTGYLLIAAIGGFAVFKRAEIK